MFTTSIHFLCSLVCVVEALNLQGVYNKLADVPLNALVVEALNLQGVYNCSIPFIVLIGVVEALNLKGVYNCRHV